MNDKGNARRMLVDASDRQPPARLAMPTVIRLLVVIAVLAALAVAGMFYLANYVGPHTREIHVPIPAERLQPPTP
jgi:hypothetical protein